MRAEKQFSRQLEMNRELKELKAKIELSLENGNSILNAQQQCK